MSPNNRNDDPGEGHEGEVAKRMVADGRGSEVAARKAFGERLYQAMLRRGWTQSELARRAGLPRDSVSTYVRGKTFPTPQSLTKLAAALEIDPKVLSPDHVTARTPEAAPELAIRSIPGRPGFAWLHINKVVTLAAAKRAMEIIMEDDDAVNSGGSGA